MIKKFFTIIRLLIVPVSIKTYDPILYFNSMIYEETFIREFSALSDRNSTKLFVGSLHNTSEHSFGSKTRA